MSSRRQLSLPLEERKSWGGARDRAGRKPNGERALVSRKKRPELNGRWPVHVTMRVRPEIPSLRVLNGWVKRALVGGANKPGFRVVHYSIQSTHLHLIVEAETAVHLSRGMQGLALRISKAVRKAMSGRIKRVFADRYHAHVLRSPRETRAALRYVLENYAKHRREAGRPVDRDFIDDRSSAVYAVGREENPLPAPNFWLLACGYAIDGPLIIGGLCVRHAQTSLIPRRP